MESSPRRKISLLSVAHPVVGKLNLFQVPEVHWAMRLTRDLNHEVKAGNALFCNCGLWVGNPCFFFVVCGTKCIILCNFV